MDAANSGVIAWVALMKRFQQAIPDAGPDGAWFPMDLIFRLTEHRGPDWARD